MDDPWWVYVLQCRDARLYCGVAKNVNHRFQAHRKGRGALFTRLNAPLKVLGARQFDSYRDACPEERRVKRLTHDEKLQWALRHGTLPIRPGTPPSLDARDTGCV